MRMRFLRAVVILCFLLAAHICPANQQIVADGIELPTIYSVDEAKPLHIISEVEKFKDSGVYLFDKATRQNLYYVTKVDLPEFTTKTAEGSLFFYFAFYSVSPFDFENLNVSGVRILLELQCTAYEKHCEKPEGRYIIETPFLKKILSGKKNEFGAMVATPLTYTDVIKSIPIKSGESYKGKVTLFSRAKLGDGSIHAILFYGDFTRVSPVKRREQLYIALPLILLGMAPLVYLYLQRQNTAASLNPPKRFGAILFFWGAALCGLVCYLVFQATELNILYSHVLFVKCVLGVFMAYSGLFFILGLPVSVWLYRMALLTAWVSLSITDDMAYREILMRLAAIIMVLIYAALNLPFALWLYRVALIIAVFFTPFGEAIDNHDIMMRVGALTLVYFYVASRGVRNRVGMQ